MEEKKIVAVFCQGTPLDPLRDEGLILLADTVRDQTRRVRGQGRARVCIFGPKTLPGPQRSEAEALVYCLHHMGDLPGAVVELITDTRRVTEHVKRLREIVENPPQKIIIVCEQSAEWQVYVSLHYYFDDWAIEVVPIPFNPGARRWLHRFFLQPLRTVLDWTYLKQPKLVGPLYRGTRRVNLWFANPDTRDPETEIKRKT